MAGNSISIPGYGGGNWQNPVTTLSTLPTVGNLQGDFRVTLDTGFLYQWQGNAWVQLTGGGGGGLTNVNLTEVGGVAITLGQETMALSIPVTIASNQSPIAISGTISGTVNSNLNGLNIFQSAQQTIGVSASQVTPTPLANRSSLSLRVTTTVSTAAIFIGPDNTVTVSSGYPLYQGDTLQMDLTPTNEIWAVSNVAGQTLYTLEMA